MNESQQVRVKIVKAEMMKKYNKTIIFITILCALLVGSTIMASGQEDERWKLEVFECNLWKDEIKEGDLLTFQHGAGFGDWATAEAERQLTEAFFRLDGVPLGPVYYEGLTEHSPGFYGDRAWADWDAKPGEHTIQSFWSHPGEGFPGDTCTFKIEKVPPPFASTPFKGRWTGIDFDDSNIQLIFNPQTSGLVSLRYKDDAATLLCGDRSVGIGEAYGTVVGDTFSTSAMHWSCPSKQIYYPPYPYSVTYYPDTNTLQDSDDVTFSRK